MKNELALLKPMHSFNEISIILRCVRVSVCLWNFPYYFKTVWMFINIRHTVRLYLKRFLCHFHPNKCELNSKMCKIKIFSCFDHFLYIFVFHSHARYIVNCTWTVDCRCVSTGFDTKQINSWWYADSTEKNNIRYMFKCFLSNSTVCEVHEQDIYRSYTHVEIFCR